MIRSFLLDPLTIKELSGISRRWQTYVGRGVFVGILGAVVLVMWASEVQSRSIIHPSQLANLGRQIFLSYFGLQLLMAAFFSITAASDQIIKERRSGTLGLLALTPLTPWRIVAGKWKASLAQAGTLVASGFPIVAVCVYLGGIGLWELAWSTALTVATICLSSAISILFSSLLRTGVGVIFVSLLALFLYVLIPILLVAMANGDDGALMFFSQVHVAFAAVVCMLNMMGGWLSGPAGAEYCWVLATLVTTGFSLLLLSWARIRVEALVTAPPSKPLLDRTFERMDEIMDQASPRPLRGIRLFTVGDQVWETGAILWKELRTRASGRLRNATRIAIGLLLFLVLPLSLLITSGNDWQVVMLWLSGIVLLVLAISSGVGLFVKEREEGKLDILLATPLTAGGIVGAKLAAGLATLIPFSVILLVIFGLLAWKARIGFLGIAMTVATVGLFVGFAYMLSAAASLHARTLRGAFSVTIGVVLAILLVLPLFMGLYDSASTTYWRDQDFPYVLVTVTNPATFLEPFAYARYAGYGYSSSLSERYARIFGYFLAYAAFYGSACVLMAGYLVRRFDRITGRSGG